jgi:hypothetical protein
MTTSSSCGSGDGRLYPRGPAPVGEPGDRLAGGVPARGSLRMGDEGAAEAKQDCVTMQKECTDARDASHEKRIAEATTIAIALRSSAEANVLLAQSMKEPVAALHNLAQLINQLLRDTETRRSNVAGGIGRHQEGACREPSTTGGHAATWWPMNLKRLLALLRFKPEPHCSKYADIDEVVGGKLRQAAQVNASANTLFKTRRRSTARRQRRLRTLPRRPSRALKKRDARPKKKAGKR